MIFPPIEAMLTMRPAPRRRIVGSTASVMQRAPEVHLHRVMVVVVRHVLERADLDHAGVIDEHVDAAEMLHHDLDRLPNVPTHADVAWDGEDVPAAEPLLRMPELLPVAASNATRAPCFRSSPAIKNPRPREPPVITTTRPAYVKRLRLLRSLMTESSVKFRMQDAHHAGRHEKGGER